MHRATARNQIGARIADRADLPLGSGPSDRPARLPLGHARLHTRRKAETQATHGGVRPPDARIALIDAAIIGAAAVSLATAYAIGDVLGPASWSCQSCVCGGLAMNTQLAQVGWNSVPRRLPRRGDWPGAAVASAHGGIANQHPGCAWAPRSSSHTRASAWITRARPVLRRKSSRGSAFSALASYSRRASVFGGSTRRQRCGARRRSGSSPAKALRSSDSWRRFSSSQCSPSPANHPRRHYLGAGELGR